MLRDDKPVGTLQKSKVRGVIIRFPGREEAEEEFAAIRQHESIDGVITGIRGRDERVPMAS